MAGKRGEKRGHGEGKSSKSPGKKSRTAASTAASQASILTFFGSKQQAGSQQLDASGCDEVCIVDDSSNGSCLGASSPGRAQPAGAKFGVPASASVTTPASASGTSGANRDNAIDLDSDAPVVGDPEEMQEGTEEHAEEEKPKIRMQCHVESKSEADLVDPQKILSDAWHPELDACWKRGEATPFLHLARTFAAIDNEKGRYKLRTAVSNMFRSILRLSPQDILAAVMLTTGKIAPAQEGIELNVGGSAVCDAIAEVTGVRCAHSLVCNHGVAAAYESEHHVCVSSRILLLVVVVVVYYYYY